MKKNKGFTLIEMIVVVAIIGVLATAVILSLVRAQAKARDSQRISDLRQIQTAVETFKEVNGVYPGNRRTWYCSYFNTDTPTVAWAPVWYGKFRTPADNVLQNQLKNYLNPLPLDPKNNRIAYSYRYWWSYTATGQPIYEIDAHLGKKQMMKEDGGEDPYRYEVGSDVNIMGNCVPGSQNCPPGYHY